MKTLKTLLFSLLFGIAALAFAADVTTTITLPADGAKIKANTETKLNYEIAPGASGDHMHVSVDGGDADIVRSFKGSYTLPKFKPGKHTIKFWVVNKGHTPVGIEQTITLTAE